jgi:plasmid stabilization system protein ParE
MTVLTPSSAERLDHEAATRSVPEIAAYLQNTVGQRVAAAIAGLVDARQIGRYAAAGGPEPREAVERRLREGFKVVRMLADAYDAKTAKAWLFGINSRLDDQAPIEILGQADDTATFASVVRAARQVAAFQG